MPAKTLHSESEILKLAKRGLTVTQICSELGYKSIGTSQRIKNICKKHDVPLKNTFESRAVTVDQKQAQAAFESKLRHNARKHISVNDGVVLIGSDAHYWPGIKSTAHRAFCRFAAELKPSAVIMNGDASDGATISRFPRIGWDARPSLMDELKACVEAMGEIEDASRTKNLYWPLGNHDARFETFLASRVPEFQGVDGFHLKDKFPLWIPCWSVWINDNTVIKHRYKGGIHAPHNNTVNSGMNIVTGHLHSLKVSPFNDYRGVRFGVDCGTMAEPGGPQFVDYMEDSPANWRSGFAVLTFHKGRLLWPEVVHVIDDGAVEFRGKVFEV